MNAIVRCSIALVVLSHLACVSEETTQKPNFLFIVVDDVGWTDGSVFGSEYYETPALDKLASEGMRFTNAYSASPLCSPTRSSLVTGKNPARLHMTAAITVNMRAFPGPVTVLPRRFRKILEAATRTELPLEQVTVAERLKEAGYHTGFIGKWHLGPEGSWPEDQGFDVNIAGGNDAGPPSYFSPYSIQTLEDGPKGEYITDRLTREAEDYMTEHKDGPFALFMWHYAVHGPWESKPKKMNRYLKKGRRDTGHRNPIYAGMLESMDAGIGRLMAKLDALEIAENTVVVFVSDNGGLVHTNDVLAGQSGAGRKGYVTSNAPLRGGKAMIHEGGIRVPMIVRWPGNIRPGTVSDVPVISDDFAPTFFELAGIEVEEDWDLDGESLVSLLKAEGTTGLKRDFPGLALSTLRQGATRSAAAVLLEYALYGDSRG